MSVSCVPSVIPAPSNRMTRSARSTELMPMGDHDERPGSSLKRCLDSRFADWIEVTGGLVEQDHLGGER